MTHAEIKKLLSEITPGPWAYCYDGSSDWTVGELPDVQAKPIASVWSKNDWWAKTHCKFISQAPQIIVQLLQEIETLELEKKYFESK